MDSRQAGQAAGRGEEEGTRRGEEGKEGGRRSRSESEKKKSRSYNIAYQPQQHARIATTCIRTTRVATTWSRHAPQTAEPVATLASHSCTRESRPRASERRVSRPLARARASKRQPQRSRHALQTAGLSCWLWCCRSLG